MLFVFDLDKVYLVDILCNRCILLLSKLVHLGSKNWCIGAFGCGVLDI